MKGAVVECHLKIHGRISSNHTFFLGLLDTFFNRRNKIPGNGSSEYFILKLKIFPSRKRFHFYLDISILTAPSCLLFVLALNIRFSSNGLFVGNFWGFEKDIDAIFFLQSIGDDLNMKLTISRNDQFISFWISFYSYSRIFFCDAMNGLRNSILISTGLWFNSKRDRRFRKINPRKFYRCTFSTQRIPCKSRL